MFLKIAGFELRYQLRSPLFRATAILFFLVSLLGMSIDRLSLAGHGDVHLNSPDALIQAHLIASFLFLFVGAAFVSGAVIRDDQTGFSAIIRSTPIRRAEYLIGRFAGAFALAAFAVAMITIGNWLGSMMPTVDQNLLGPNRIGNYLLAFGLFGLPGAFVICATLFALATLTRSTTGTFIGVIGVVACYVAAQGMLGALGLQGARSLADPFGLAAFQIATRYSTTAELNEAVPLTAVLLWGRLLWVSIAVGLLALTCLLFRFSEPGASKRQRRRGDREESSATVPAGGRLPPLPTPMFGTTALRAQLAARIRMEARHIVRSPGFPIMLLLASTMCAISLWFNEGQFGDRAYPRAAILIDLVQDYFGIISGLIAIFYGGELVWRERERRLNEIVDATPLPTWALMIPKMIALAMILLSVLVAGLGVGLGVQFFRGAVELEPGKFLLWYLLPASADMLLLAALSITVQALSPGKYAGWALMSLYLGVRFFGAEIGLEHNLLVYGRVPAVPLSDLNGLGIYWQAAWWYRLFWAAMALLLLLAVHLLWPRGTDTALRPQLRRLPARLKGRAGIVASVASSVLALSGGWIVYNTAVLNPHVTSSEWDAYLAEYEKRFLRYLNVPQPTIRHVDLKVDLYPDQVRAEVSGRYRLVNETGRPVERVHVRRATPELEILAVDLSGGRLERDHAEFGYRIYRLDTPMMPGEARTLGFRTRREQRGFRDTGADQRLVPNGTDLNNLELTPRIGMNLVNLLQGSAKRRAHGLPEEHRKPKLEDVGATRRTGGGFAWSTADITVSTSSDQVPIAPGRKVAERVERGRRMARFVSDAPMLDFFSAQSGRYAVRTQVHDGVRLSVYHHPGHHWNVDRMMRAMRLALGYYGREFGPYQFDQARIVETPSYRQGAQAFANTIPFSETFFTSDFRDPEATDLVTFATAHELAHQWWGHQVAPAGVQGSEMLVETLAQYSALMVLERAYGEAAIRRFLMFQLDRYLMRRRSGSIGELPLARVEEHPHIAYGKGAVVMYLLRRRLGEEAVNRALRRFVAQRRFQGPPFARSTDLIALFRREARTPAQQALITDLFERITLYDLEAEAATATPRADGRWDVKLSVKARKFYADEAGREREVTLDEPIEIGLFTAQPGLRDFDRGDVLIMKPMRVRSGRQVLHFVTDRAPSHAGIDPYNFYIDRRSDDNVKALGS